MYRIRFHGRGGQGMKTASRILGTAFFLAGFEVQDAPRYGAERRGAPIFAYVRADRKPINERGVINHPDLVAVADDSLVALPAAGVLQGIGSTTVLLVDSRETPGTWQHRLNLPGLILTLTRQQSADEPPAVHFRGAGIVGAVARLVGVIDQDSMAQAIRRELAALGDKEVERNLEAALEAYEQMAEHAGAVQERVSGTALDYKHPEWINLPFEEARVSAPAIHVPATSVAMQTGLWRTQRPVIDYDRCKRCWWVCSTFCPESAITIDPDHFPRIDYDHCKGCMVCVSQCSSHAIAIRQEEEETETTTGGKRS